MKLADVFGGSLLGGVKDIIGSLKLDPAKKAEIEQHFEDNRQIVRLKEIELQATLQEHIAKEVEATAANIQAEAKSEDKWTSRARPTFLYVMYAMILFAIPYSLIFAFRPDKAKLVAEGMQLWLAALPDQLYWLFGAGYLGYTGARSVQQWRKGAKK